MTDLNSGLKAPDTPRPARPGGATTGPFRSVLWVVLLLSAGANMVTSSSDLNPLIGAMFGLATLACAVALGMHYRRHRRR